VTLKTSKKNVWEDDKLSTTEPVIQAGDLDVTARLTRCEDKVFYVRRGWSTLATVTPHAIRVQSRILNDIFTFHFLISEYSHHRLAPRSEYSGEVDGFPRPIPLPCNFRKELLQMVN